MATSAALLAVVLIWGLVSGRMARYSITLLERSGDRDNGPEPLMKSYQCGLIAGMFLLTARMPTLPGHRSLVSRCCCRP